MKRIEHSVLCLVLLAGNCVSACGEDKSWGVIPRESLISPLHSEVQNNGGEIKRQLVTNSHEDVSDLRELVAKSDEVVLVHILANRCTISPNGKAPITLSRALVLRRLKGSKHSSNKIMLFSMPTGHLRFVDGMTAHVYSPNFHVPNPGERYIAFLRHSDEAERELTPELRLSAGDGMQGLFGVKHELISPSFRTGNIAEKYRGMPVTTFLKELKSITKVRERDGAH